MTMKRYVFAILGMSICALSSASVFAANNTSGTWAITTSSKQTIVLRISSCQEYIAEVKSHAISYQLHQLTGGEKIRMQQKYRIAMKQRRSYCAVPTKSFSWTILPLNTGYFTVTHTALLKKLSAKEKALIQKHTNLYGSIVTQQIDNLIASWFLLPKDKGILSGKIIFSYENSCKDPFRGNTTFKERRRDGAFLRNEIVSISLKIFLCFDEQHLNALENDFFHVATHELAHYYNFIHDADPYYFSTICRTQWVKKPWCGKDAFVTPYAMSEEKEDYAETFAFRYLGKFPTVKSGSALAQKKKYFDDRYKLLHQ